MLPPMLVRRGAATALAAGFLALGTHAEMELSADGNRLFLLADARVWRSSDRGRTWELSLERSPRPSSGISAIRAHPRDPAQVFAVNLQLHLSFPHPPADTEGAGMPIGLREDTGAFWFFDGGNLELLIKVLDACSFTGRYWIFAGGLTDVEVVITVTDTASGSSKRYRNPAGTPFQPIQDTQAFDTCS